MVEVKVWGDFAHFSAQSSETSHPCMTPAAAKGILEAIYWKPYMQWCVSEIWILNPIYWSDEGPDLIRGMHLKDVCYLIKAVAKASDGNIYMHHDRFRRRVRQGKSFRPVYLGFEEFPAYFSEPDGSERPIAYDADIPQMLLRLEFHGKRVTPIFFDAKIRDGVLRVPSHLQCGDT